MTSSTDYLCSTDGSKLARDGTASVLCLGEDPLEICRITVHFFPRPACKARGRGQGATIHGEHEKPPLKIGEVAETKIRPGFR